MLRDASLIPLSQQHHNGLALAVMTRRSLASDGSAGNVAKLAQRVIDRYELELVNHFEIEEQVLFPACGDLPIVAELIAEHRAMEAMVAEVRSVPTAELLERFCELISTHIRREERELFEEIQRTLSRETLDAAGSEIDRRAVRICM
ncbi:MAG: hemerythrin domain-containing protein [Candidatus Solibacter sp.]